MRVGECPPRLDVLLERVGRSGWCFVTAWNPRSVEQPLELNRASNHALKADLDALGCPIFAGIGRAVNADWTPEESFLALGLDRDQAAALGRSYDQNAVVWGRAGQAAELVDCGSRAAS